MKKVIYILILYLIFLSPLHAQQFLWGSYGIGDADVGNIETDNKGNCYLAGLIPNDTVHFGSYTLMNSTITNAPYSNYYDPILVKYDAKGNLLWAKQWIELDTSWGHSIPLPATLAVGNNGSVYLDGDFTDTIIVGIDTIIDYSYGNTCLAKYDSNGNVKWVRVSRHSNNTDSTSATIKYASCDNFGNIFLLGNASYDTIYFGAYKLYYLHNLYFNDFLVKYDSSGNVKWARQVIPHNLSSGSVSFGVANDKIGNIYTTGGFYDTVLYGSYTLSDTNGSDFDIVKWDSSGNVLWAKQAKPENSQPTGATGISVTTDKFGNAYACAQFYGSFIIGLDTIKQPPNYQDNFFVVKYSPNGSVIWVRQATILDGAVWDAWSISSDTNNNLYLTGNGGGGDTCKIAFGGDTLKLIQTNPNQACFLFKLDSSGKATCGAIISKGIPEGTSVTSDPSGKHVYLSSSFSTLAIFGKDTINPSSFPVHISGSNFFPVVARWEACDSSILQSTPGQLLPKGAQLSVFPNPNRGSFTIQIRSEELSNKNKIEIFDVLGQRVYSSNINSSNTKVNLGIKPAGIYFYRVTSETGALVGEGKVIVE